MPVFVVVLSLDDVLCTFCAEQEGPTGSYLVGSPLGQEALKGADIWNKHWRQRWSYYAATGETFVTVAAQCMFLDTSALANVKHQSVLLGILC